VSSICARSAGRLPEIRPGDDLAGLIVGALETGGEPPLRDDQIVAIAHKAVSKAEGAVVILEQVTPAARARELGRELGKDPRLVQVILEQAEEVVRAERGVLICRTRTGLVCANAGVDASNSAQAGAVILHPRDPDGSARRLRERLRELTGARPAVLISDSFGRPWRVGQSDVAIGCAGMTPLEDWRGREDSAGHPLHATWIAVADAAAAAADLARAKDSREPVVLLEGLGRFISAADGPGAVALVRELDEDLFR
jgi:coenzyme F420-0:L-glutamate ligase / coenzyme F420-1:gamma-L-glutamate ligase